MARNLDLDLNLPTDPGLPPGEEYDEFRKIYNALRQLQDGIAEAAGLFTLAPEDRGGSDMFELYTLGRHTFTVFEAGTDINIGQPCQIYSVGGEAKVRQPAQLYFINAFEGGAAAAMASGYMPLFNAAAGQKVACAGYGGEAPLPGAVPGQRYALNTSFVMQAYTGKIGYYYTVNSLLINVYYMLMGICVNENKLRTFPTYWASAY